MYSVEFLESLNQYIFQETSVNNELNSLNVVFSIILIPYTVHVSGERKKGIGTFRSITLQPRWTEQN